MVSDGVAHGATPPAPDNYRIEIYKQPLPEIHKQIHKQPPPLKFTVLPPDNGERSKNNKTSTERESDPPPRCSSRCLKLGIGSTVGLATALGGVAVVVTTSIFGGLAMMFGGLFIMACVWIGPHVVRS